MKTGGAADQARAVLLALVGRGTCEPAAVRRDAGAHLDRAGAGRLKRFTRSDRNGELLRGHVGEVSSHGPGPAQTATFAPCLRPRAGLKGGLNATGTQKTAAWQRRVGYPNHATIAKMEILVYISRHNVGLSRRMYDDISPN